MTILPPLAVGLVEQRFSSVEQRNLLGIIPRPAVVLTIGLVNRAGLAYWASSSLSKENNSWSEKCEILCCFLEIKKRRS